MASLLSDAEKDPEFVQMAVKKLLCGQDYRPSDTQHVLAVLSTRLLLNLANTLVSSKIAVEAIRSHMRILIRVDNHSILVTGTPSEPMLAIAAMTKVAAGKLRER